jgi:hypothetical protein
MPNVELRPQKFDTIWHLRDFLSVAVFEKFLHFNSGAFDEVGAWVNVGAVDDELAEVVDVGLGHPLRVGKNFGYVDRYTDLE